MIIVDAPALAPGACFLTRTSEGRMVDTFLDVDDLAPVGRIYLAETTVSDLAQMFGFTPPAASARLRDRLSALETQIVDMRAALNAQTAANGALVHAGWVAAGEASTLVPSGPTPMILDWVGDDLDRATAALKAEEAEKYPRVGLVRPLTLMVTSDEPVAHAATYSRNPQGVTP